MEVLGKLRVQWESLNWHIAETPQPHEATLLYLDSAKARSLLRWRPVWGFDTTLLKTAEWYRAWFETGTVITLEQLASYVADADVAANTANATDDWDRT